MSTLHIRTRRRIGNTITGLPAHQQNMRAANDEQEDGALRVAKGLLAACALGAVLWIVLGALLWWGVELLAQ